MKLYRNEHSNAKFDAQCNLMGRTHYADPDTLRFHKSRILATRVHAEGLLYLIIESVAIDMHNKERGFRYVIFDIFGTVVDRPGLNESFGTKAAAEKALWAAIESIDAIGLTRTALINKRAGGLAEFKSDMEKLKDMAAK